MPIINQPSLFTGVDSATGLGDINPSFFFSPAKPGGLIWGIGPTFTLPTASDRLLGSGKWSMGPTGVALAIEGPWVFGALINNQWSFAGWGDKPVNAVPMVRQLQSSRRLVLDHFADSDGGLKGRQGRRCVDGAAGRWRREAV
jgi:hypothetical protein